MPMVFTPAPCAASSTNTTRSYFTRSSALKKRTFDGRPSYATWSRCIASSTLISCLLRSTFPFSSAVMTVWSGGTESGGTGCISGWNSGTRRNFCFSASGVRTMKMMRSTSTTSMSGVTLMSVTGFLVPSAIPMALTPCP